MKKLLAIAALSLAAAPAMASKARMTSLSSAAHLIDTQTLFVNPGDIHYLGEFATIEFGDNTSTYSATGVTRNPKAEGGFVRKVGTGSVGAYIGHRSETTTAFIDGINVAIRAAGGTNTNGELLTEQNPLDLFYGTEVAGMKMGFDLHYSNSKQDLGSTTTVTQKVNTAGVSAGIRNDVWNGYLRVGLAGKTESNKAVFVPELESKGLYKLGGGCFVNSLYYFANYEYATGTSKVATTTTDITKNQYEVGMINNQKVDTGNFFYGLSYVSYEVKKEAATKTTTSYGKLPLVIGVELDAASWMTLRGTVKQSVLIGDSKDDGLGTSSYANILTNDTEIAAGVGLKFNKITVDATLAGATTGAVNGNTLLANASMTYNF
jgi:hypothetical protein